MKNKNTPKKPNAVLMKFLKNVSIAFSFPMLRGRFLTSFIQCHTYGKKPTKVDAFFLRQLRHILLGAISYTFIQCHTQGEKPTKVQGIIVHCIEEEFTSKINPTLPFVLPLPLPIFVPQDGFQPFFSNLVKPHRAQYFGAFNTKKETKEG